MVASGGNAAAQSKGRPAKGAKPPASAGSAAPAAASAEPAKPEATAADTASPSSSAVTSGDDLGAPPPKQSEGAATVRRSPLTPEPNEFPVGAPKPPPVAYDKLLSDIAALRSRVASVTTTLFSSKLRVLVEVEGDDARVASFRVTLDDGVVYAAPERFNADEPQAVYEHAVAPGHHMLGVEIERYDARNRQYRTYQSSKFSIVVPEGKRLESSLRIEDDSDMADDFPSGEDGEYDLRVRLRAQVID
ncbi:MAG TPA: hypothetical protein VGK73_06130 [Polyangiaceae bacterium]